MNSPITSEFFLPDIKQPLEGISIETRTMGSGLDPTGILGVIVVIAGAQIAKAQPYGVPQPTGIFTADPNHRRHQPQPTGILAPDPYHRRRLQPTGIIAADPTGVFALDPNNRHRRAGKDVSQDVEREQKPSGILDPTGTYR